MSSTLQDRPVSTVAAASSRVASVDLIRGAVMILMAIDHVRVYSGLPPGGPTPGIFFTRWITHFCAPAFIFLAGTSAFFYGRRHPGPGAKVSEILQAFYRSLSIFMVSPWLAAVIGALFVTLGWRVRRWGWSQSA